MITVIPMASIRTRKSPSVLLLTGGLLVTALLMAGCSGEEAVPIDPANPPVLDAEPPNVTHSIDPTPQMEELARQQCVDDPSLDEGYVEAVDPDTEQVLSRISIDCDEVRPGG